jgi:hypothetical protein
VPHEASVAQLVVNSFTTFYSVQVFVYGRLYCTLVNIVAHIWVIQSCTNGHTSWNLKIRLASFSCCTYCLDWRSYIWNVDKIWLSWPKYATKGNWRTNFQSGLETLLKLVINLQVRRAWRKIAKFRRNIPTSRSCGPRHPPCCMELTVQWTFNSEGKS